MPRPDAVDAGVTVPLADSSDAADSTLPDASVADGGADGGADAATPDDAGPDSTVVDAAIDATIADAGPCVAEDNGAFCTRLAKNCGAVAANDNCGPARSVASCGVCASYYESCGGAGAANVCGCLPESDWAFCTRTGNSCGSASGTDNCGNARAAPSCGGVCPADAGAGEGGYPPGSDAELCSRLSLQCGVANVVDLAGHMRTVSCGLCAAGLACGQQNPNQCSDNNECAVANICPSETDCFNTRGSFRCEARTAIVPGSTQRYLAGSPTTRFTLPGASSYCSALALRSGVWHLASSAELFTIHGDVPPSWNPYSSTVGATDTPLWSSTPLLGLPALMSVNTGTLTLGPSSGDYLAGATCLEGPAPAAASLRFVALADGVIRDDQLGVSWLMSQLLCARTTTAGGGWRYARASEAISLVAESAAGPIVKPGAPLFGNSQRLLGTTR